MKKTRRECLICKKTTTWAYNRTTGHSECEECGNKYAGKTTVQRIIEGRKSVIPQNQR